jgi:hypothetical protein
MSVISIIRCFWLALLPVRQMETASAVPTKCSCPARAQMLRNKHVENPPKKHDDIPL